MREYHHRRVGSSRVAAASRDICPSPSETTPSRQYATRILETASSIHSPPVNSASSVRESSSDRNVRSAPARTRTAAARVPASRPTIVPGPVPDPVPDGPVPGDPVPGGPVLRWLRPRSRPRFQRSREPRVRPARGRTRRIAPRVFETPEAGAPARDPKRPPSPSRPRHPPPPPRRAHAAERVGHRVGDGRRCGSSAAGAPSQHISPAIPAKTRGASPSRSSNANARWSASSGAPPLRGLSKTPARTRRSSRATAAPGCPRSPTRRTRVRRDAPAGR